MWLCKYFVYFMIYSLMGWIYETIYCTVRSGKWDNRGFLYGPMCPIYGVGGVVITGLSDLASEGILPCGWTWWQLFGIAFFGSIVLEYGTSWVLEKLFHAYWWDYSDLPLNLHGRVCLPYSVGFGLAGLLIVYGIAPLLHRLTDGISPLGYEFLALLAMGIVTCDTTLTVVALTDFEDRVADLDERLNHYMENLVSCTAEEREQIWKEHMQSFVHNMGNLRKSSLRRVKGFRHTKKADIQHMHMVLSHLKEEIANRSEKRKRKYHKNV